MDQIRYIDYQDGISAIDAQYKRPGLVAIHLLIEGGRAAIIDSGTNRSVDCVMQVLAAKGLQPQDVDYLIITHVHLDHAGGAGELLRRLPNARTVLHPRGARHLVDPTKLIAGVATVYGTDEAERSFGQIVPIPRDRIIEAPDQFGLALNGRNLLFIDTPGHARHHFCILDERSRAIFTGDTFGLSYREFDTSNGEFIFPTTTPVQFDPPALHASIDRLMHLSPRNMFLTHFGRVGNLERLAKDLHECIDAFVSLARNLRDAGPPRHGLIKREIERVLLARLAQHGCRLKRESIMDLMQMDIELNAQGLGVWLDHEGTN